MGNDPYTHALSELRRGRLPIYLPWVDPTGRGQLAFSVGSVPTVSPLLARDGLERLAGTCAAIVHARRRHPDLRRMGQA